MKMQIRDARGTNPVKTMRYKKKTGMQMQK